MSSGPNSTETRSSDAKITGDKNLSSVSSLRRQTKRSRYYGIGKRALERHHHLHPSTGGTSTRTFIQRGESSSTCSADDLDECFEYDHERIVRQWKESAFAVGCTKATWDDENIDCYELCSCCCGCTTDEEDFFRASRMPPGLMPGSRRRGFHLRCTAFLCSKIGAGRVGNMVVLRQRLVHEQEGQEVAEDERDHSGDNETTTSKDDGTTTTTAKQKIRPKLICVLGPYWVVMAFVTVPAFLILSLLAGMTKVASGSLPLVWIVSWALVNAGLFISLFLVACTDPGILYRHRQLPSQPQAQTIDVHVGDKKVATTIHGNERETSKSKPNNNNNNNNNNKGGENSGGDDVAGVEWRWNDQAFTYRPVTAMYDPECAVVVDQFDHTCALTGTAIGKNNMLWFRFFVFFAAATLVVNLYLLAC